MIEYDGMIGTAKMMLTMTMTIMAMIIASLLY